MFGVVTLTIIYFTITICVCSWKIYFISLHIWVTIAWLSLIVSYLLYYFTKSKKKNNKLLFYAYLFCITLLFFMLQWADLINFNFIDFYIWEFFLKPSFWLKDKAIGLYNGMNTLFWLLSNNYHTKELVLYIPDNLDCTRYWSIDLILKENLFLLENKLNTITIKLNPLNIKYNNNII